MTASIADATAAPLMRVDVAQPTTTSIAEASPGDAVVSLADATTAAAATKGADE